MGAFCSGLSSCSCFSKTGQSNSVSLERDWWHLPGVCLEDLAAALTTSELLLFDQEAKLPIETFVLRAESTCCHIVLALFSGILVSFCCLVCLAPFFGNVKFCHFNLKMTLCARTGSFFSFLFSCPISSSFHFSHMALLYLISLVNGLFVSLFVAKIPSDSSGLPNNAGGLLGSKALERKLSAETHHFLKISYFAGSPPGLTNKDQLL